MPRRKAKVPSYCLHKASGRAVVRIDGRDIYLGEYGSAENHDEYQRVVAQWRAAAVAENFSRPERVAAAGFDLTLAQVLLRYKGFAESYYVKNGEPTKELTEMRYALKPVRILYGDTLAREFGPLKLRNVRVLPGNGNRLG